MLRITELRLPLDHAEGALRAAVLARLGLRDGQLRGLSVFRRAWDARKKSAVVLIYTVDCTLAEDVDEAVLLARHAGDVQVRAAPDTRYRFVGHAPADFYAASRPRPVVIGFGPCGIFAALVLAQMGLRPIVLERGKAVRERTQDTWGLWRRGVLDPQSNVQFGEGGAGTFSDGKLWSQISDARHLTRKVLNEFVKAGAPEGIVAVARERDRQDRRLVDVRLGDGRRVGIPRQIPNHGGHAVAHVLRRRVNVPIQVERDDDERGAGTVDGAQFLDAFDRVEDLFNGLGTCDSISAGEAPGEPALPEPSAGPPTGKAIHVELHIPRHPNTTRRSTIIVAKTGRRMQISASFCMGQLGEGAVSGFAGCERECPSGPSLTVTRWPVRRLLGSNTNISPISRPDNTSTQPGPRRPVRMTFSAALPSSTTTTFSSPAKVMIAAPGTVNACSCSVTMI